MRITTRDSIAIRPVQTTLPGGGVLTSVLTALTTINGQAVEVGLDLLKYSTKCFSLRNAGTSPLSIAKVQTSLVPAERRATSDWVDFDTTTFANLAAGASKQLTVN